eukprot:scaffold771_cov170-Amphora_coffeaeformis.AAC.2
MVRRMILPSLKKGVRSPLERQYRVFSTKKPDDLSYARTHVRDHDPAGYLPGQLLPTPIMQKSYYAVRSFWVETGLRFGSTAKVSLNATPEDHLIWWQQGVDTLFDSDTNIEESKDFNHPTLRLLQSILRHDKVPWEKSCFDTIIDGRRRDVSVKQYNTLDDLIHHAEQSCGHLNRLVLQSGLVDETNNPQAYEAARLVGICHGITNALRTSIPIISTTGKLIVPAELTQKYGVKSPRYLLSALGQGDETCVRALQSAVQDIADAARSHLEQARALRSSILSEPGHTRSLPVLLPGLASEMFLNRLKDKKYELTNRELRNVGWVEHGLCAARMYLAFYQKTY